MLTRHALVLLALAAAAPARAATPVDRVVVFSDRAEVTRLGTASCQGDKATLTFSPLPLSLDERTLRAEASGEAVALGVTARVVPREEPDDSEVAQLERRIEALADRQQAQEEDRSDLGRRLGLLGHYAGFAASVMREELRNARPDVARWKRLLDRLREERSEAARRGAEIEQEMRKLAREESVLQRRLARLSAPQTPEHRTATVVVDCRSAARPQVALSYVVPQATWHPEYDVRFLPARGTDKTGPGQMELTVAAVVQQSTGEDWESARIVLSTAKPRLGAEAPLPRPLYVRGQEEGKEKVLVDAHERRDKLQGPASGEGRGPAAAELQDRGRSFSLTLPRRATVKADGRPYWMPVDVTRGRATSKLVTLPKLRPWVYRVVQAKNPAAYPLLQGRAHVYRGGSFVGDARMKYVAPGEPMELSLGIDAEVKVERKGYEPFVQELGRDLVKEGVLEVPVKLSRAKKRKKKKRGGKRKSSGGTGYEEFDDDSYEEF